MPALAAWSWKVGIRGDGSGGELNSLNVAAQEMRIRQSPFTALAFENFKRSTVSWQYEVRLLAPRLDQEFLGVRLYHQT